MQFKLATGKHLSLFLKSWKIRGYWFQVILKALIVSANKTVKQIMDNAVYIRDRTKKLKFINQGWM